MQVNQYHATDNPGQIIGTANAAQAYIETAERELFGMHGGWNFVSTFDDTGILGYMLSDGGIYSEGMNYSDFCFELLNVFFTAYNRISGINHFNHPVISNYYHETIRQIAPDISEFTFDDATLHIYSNTHSDKTNSFFQFT